MDDPQQNRKDVEHLRQLAIFHFVGAGLAFLTLGLAAYTKSGVVGRPSLATAAKGEGALAHLVTAFAEVLEALGQ